MGTIPNHTGGTTDIPIKNVRRWLIGGAIILYLFPFCSSALNKYRGCDLWELHDFLGLEVEAFMSMWIALGAVVVAVIGVFQKQGSDTQQQVQFEKQQYNEGVKLLGNSHESTRIGGAHSLYLLACESPKKYLNPVCEILCAHLRSIANKDKFKTDKQLGKYPWNEVQTVIDLLFKERDGEAIFKYVKKNLSQTFWRDVDFLEAKLRDVNFWKAELYNVNFNEVELDNVSFNEAELDNVNLDGTKLYNVSCNEAKLNDIDFSEAELEDVRFNKARLINVVFSEEKLKDVRFWDAKLNKVCFHRTNFS